MYKENVDLLIPHLQKFNGKRIVVIAQGDGIMDAQVVMNDFPSDANIDFRIVTNNVELGETPHFFPILDELYSLNKNEITMYAHAKGVSYDVSENNERTIRNIKKWRDRMYENALGDLSTIESLLGEYACVGSFRRQEHNQRVHGDASWHYSGTFFWFNHHALYSLPEYSTHKNNRCGVESWLGHNVPIGRSACVYCCDLGQRTSVYGFRARDWNRYDEIGLSRTDFINAVARRNGAISYLEIGVRNPRQNFRKIRIEHKIGVDINPRSKAQFTMCSDDYFASNKSKFDIIFIDGDHTYRQSKRDIANALQALRRNGVVVCHDVWPESERAASPTPIRGAWSGEVYRAFAEILARPSVSGFSIRDDHGIGALINKPNEGRKLPVEFDWHYLQGNPHIVNQVKDLDTGWTSL